MATKISTDNPLSKITIFLIIISVIWVKLNVKPWAKGKIIDWDIVDYYDYLPALFIENDWTLSFVKKNEEYYYNNHIYWPQKTSEGNYVIKMSMGLSYLYLPFFWIGHLEAKIKGLPTDGFSQPYHKWIYLSAVFYFFIGLWFLRLFLLRWFRDKVVAIAIILLVLATNLFYYATHESAMSHVYTFSLFSVLIYLWDRWFAYNKLLTGMFIGFISGLIVLIRPINIIPVVVFPLFYNLIDIKQIKDRVVYLLTQYQQIILMVFFAILPWIPQFYYWHLNTGQWFYYSYGDEKFFFLKPQIINGLWSYRKGWLLYNPLMYLTILGIPVLWKYRRSLFWSYVIIFPLYIYVVFSWWCWWYGGSYGGRAMIDIYPVLIFALAAIIDRIFNLERSLRFFKYVSMIPAFMLIYWNILQIIQYRHTFLHYDSMTKEAYWKLFGKPALSDTAYWSLLSPPDYEKAKRGESEYP